nr:hypothetical protein Q903MT_gene5987 [Picea sitchensis]
MMITFHHYQPAQVQPLQDSWRDTEWDSEIDSLPFGFRFLVLFHK